MLKKGLAFTFVAALLAVPALSLLSSGGTAEATIHPIVQSECAKLESQTGAGQDQDPPGISDPEKQTFARPVFAILGNPGGALTVDTHGSPDPGDWTWGGPAYSGQGEFHCTNPEAPNTHPD